MYTVQLCHTDRAASSTFHRLKTFERKQSLTTARDGRYQPNNPASVGLPSEKGWDFQLVLVYRKIFVTHGALVFSRVILNLSTMAQKGGNFQVIVTAKPLDNSQVGFGSDVDFTDSGGDNGNPQFVTSTLIQHRAPDNIGIFVGLFLDQ
jgi:hypothetical protein